LRWPRSMALCPVVGWWLEKWPWLSGFRIGLLADRPCRIRRGLERGVAASRVSAFWPAECRAATLPSRGSPMGLVGGGSFRPERVEVAASDERGEQVLGVDRLGDAGVEVGVVAVPEVAELSDHDPADRGSFGCGEAMVGVDGHPVLDGRLLAVGCAVVGPDGVGGFGELPGGDGRGRLAGAAGPMPARWRCRRGGSAWWWPRPESPNCRGRRR
jgi:hypothetical protein